MSGWAAEKAADKTKLYYNSSMIDIIRGNASKPDDFGFPNIPNYDHYYNPSNGVGGAPSRMGVQLSWMNNSYPGYDKAMYLSYASHYMCDMSMPLHTDKALIQVDDLWDTEIIELINNGLDSQIHMVYEKKRR
jgi:hypothetical protein